MARRGVKVANAGSFKPGQSGNPGGKPKNTVPEHIRAAKALVDEQFFLRLVEIGKAKRSALTEIIADKDAPANDVIFAQLVLDASFGNFKARECYFNRVWGAVKPVEFDEQKDAQDPMKVLQKKLSELDPAVLLKFMAGQITLDMGPTNDNP